MSYKKAIATAVLAAASSVLLSSCGTAAAAPLPSTGVATAAFQWFGIAPNGAKEGVGGDDEGRDNEGGNDTATSGAASVANTATNAILFDDARFSDNGPSQGVDSSGADDTGCIDVGRLGVTSSISAEGTYTIWTETDCKGESLQLDGDVADLASVGFDDRVASMKLRPPRD